MVDAMQHGLLNVAYFAAVSHARRKGTSEHHQELGTKMYYGKKKKRLEADKDGQIQHE